MGRPSKRERRPAGMKAVKAWALINFDGILLNGEQAGDAALGEGLAIYPRRYLARIAASNNPDVRVVPIVVRSLQHRRR